MKKLLVCSLILLLMGAAAWENRVNLMVWAISLVYEFSRPIDDHIDPDWAEGPDYSSRHPSLRPPNVILILADDLGFNDISLYNGGAGDGNLLTPHIDALAGKGVAFTKAYAANAVCAPSRASIMTGRYSTRYGFEFTPFYKIGVQLFKWMQEIEDPELKAIFDDEAIPRMGSLESGVGMPLDEITIAQVLKEAGYYTAHIGKWHLGEVAPYTPINRGFDDSLTLSGASYLPENDEHVVNSKLDDAIDKMVWAAARHSARFNDGKEFKPRGYITDYYTEEAIKVIENNRHRPFFLYMSHWAVHNPLQALKNDYEYLSHIKNHNLRVYSAMISALDRSVGQIVDALKINKLEENTLVIFTSDNGGAAYIELSDINKPFRGWKLNHFEGGIHVPFIMKWPINLVAGSSFEKAIHHNDIFSTIVSAVKADMPSDRLIDGVDLLPYLMGLSEGDPHETLFWKEGHHQTVLNKNWKLIRSERPNKRWLFNLKADPTETKNLVDSEKEILKNLEALLDQHVIEQAKPLWPSVVDSPQLIDKHGGESYEEGDEYIYWPN